MKTASHRSRMAVKSAPQKNKLPPWQHRLDEVQRADKTSAKELAQHHVSQLLDRDIKEAKRAVDDGMSLLRDAGQGARPKLPSGREPVDGAFSVCALFPERLEPGIAALTKVADGQLPEDLAAHACATQALIGEIEGLRSSCGGRSKLPIETEGGLLRQIRVLIDQFETAVLTFYAAAKGRYALPALWRFTEARSTMSVIHQDRFAALLKSR